MSDDTVISVQNISKAYRIWESPAARLVSPMQAGLAGWLPGKLPLAVNLRRRAASRYKDFYALSDVSFTVKRGESVGIIGRNGSGKSTLLQIITGTLQPTAGSVRVDGRVAALLELGSGFNPEFTGRENVFLTGAILGFRREQMEQRFAEIAAFADIGEFIEQPVKTYSSGMILRIAFAVQTAVEPDILIVDEALSVGDFFFQQKCFQRIARLRQQGTTILFVSHDMGTIRDLCHSTLYLKQGQRMEFGETQQAISLYLREEATRASPPDAAPLPKPAGGQTKSILLHEINQGAIWVNEAAGQAEAAHGVAQIVAVRVLDSRGQPNTTLRMGQPVVIQAYVLALENASLHLAVEIKNRHGQLVSSIGSRVAGLSPLPAVGGEVLEFEAEIILGLESGEYSLQAVLGLPDARPNVGTRVHATPWLGPLTIQWDYEQEPAPFLGMFHLPARIKFSVCHTTDQP